MKFIISIVLIALLSLSACFFCPWWVIAIVAFAVSALIPQSPGRSFLTGFVALFLLWGGLTWYISAANTHILANKMSLLILQSEGAFLLIFITALLGALVAAFAALAGSFVHKGIVVADNGSMDNL